MIETVSDHKAEIDSSQLISLDSALSLQIDDIPYRAVDRTLRSVLSLLGSNLPDYSRAQNSFYKEYSRCSFDTTGGLIVQGALRVRCADKVIHLRRRQTIDNCERIAEAKQATEARNGRFRVGSEVVKIWEHTSGSTGLVVEATRIHNSSNEKIPEYELLDDFLIDAGPVLEDITGLSLDESTDFSFIAKLTHDYLRTELQHANLNYPEYFSARTVRGQPAS